MGFLINSFIEFPVAGFFFEDDFSSDNWTDIGSNIGVAGGVLAGVYIRNGNNASWIDMTGSSLSDTEWVARFQYNVKTVTASGTNFSFFGVSDANGNTGAVNGRDGLGIEILLDGGAPSFKMNHPNAQGWNDNTTTMSSTPSVAIYYVQWQRISSTSYTINLYSDSGFSTLIESKNATIDSGIVSLRYLVDQSLNAGSSGATIAIDIDDIQIKDGTSTF